MAPPVELVRPALTIGQHVRLTTSDGTVLSGRIGGVTDGYVLLNTTHGLREVPNADITSVEIEPNASAFATATETPGPDRLQETAAQLFGLRETSFHRHRARLETHASRGPYFDRRSIGGGTLSGYIQSRQVGIHGGWEWGAVARRDRGPSITAQASFVHHEWDCSEDLPCLRTSWVNWSAASLRVGRQWTTGGAEIGITTVSELITTFPSRVAGPQMLPSLDSWIGPRQFYFWQEAFLPPRFGLAGGVGTSSRFADLRVGLSESGWTILRVDARLLGGRAGLELSNTSAEDNSGRAGGALVLVRIAGPIGRRERFVPRFLQYGRMSPTRTAACADMRERYDTAHRRWRTCIAAGHPSEGFRCDVEQQERDRAAQALRAAGCSEGVGE